MKGETGRKMFCGKCGKQLEDNAVVCPWCGEATGIEPKEKFVHQQENGGYGQNFDNRSNVNRDAAKPMTLLGISVGLMAMLIYYSGVISSVVLILVAGYVLLKEEDRWLRAVAAKAISIVCIFGAISGVIIINLKKKKGTQTISEDQRKSHRKKKREKRTDEDDIFNSYH